MIAVYRDDKRIAERARLGQVVDVARMNKIETTVCEHYRFARVPQPLAFVNQFLPVEYFLHCCEKRDRYLDSDLDRLRLKQKGGSIAGVATVLASPPSVST
jgi:hypothetical protein